MGLGQISQILVVCVGNVCRSPLGERALNALLPELDVRSAGLAALVGQTADPDAAFAAQQNAVSVDGHVARQFNRDMGRNADLILVMEPGHKHNITRQFPHFSGKVFLFDHWGGGKGIADPYQRSAEFHHAVAGEICRSAQEWADRLRPKGAD